MSLNMFNGDYWFNMPMLGWGEWTTLIYLNGITLVGDYEVEELGDAFIEFLHI